MAPLPPDEPRLVWWHELLFIGVSYGVYSLVRNLFGSGSVSADTAYANARHVIDLEQRLHIFNELDVQQWFLGVGWFLRFWNIFYGSVHFVMPVVVLVFLYRRYPRDYPVWRNTLMIATALALVGFSLFPLMPPRLLCDCPYGAGPGVDGGFVDTLEVHGGIWNFGSSTMKSVSNQYAAMPSLHLAWALWCCLALFGRVRRRWLRALIVLYPVATLFGIVVTANHYWLDAVGGALVVGIGYLLGAPLARFWTARGVAARARREAARMGAG